MVTKAISYVLVVNETAYRIWTLKTFFKFVSIKCKHNLKLDELKIYLNIIACYNNNDNNRCESSFGVFCMR